MYAAWVIEKNDHNKVRRIYITKNRIVPTAQWRLSSEDKKIKGGQGSGELGSESALTFLAFMQ